MTQLIPLQIRYPFDPTGNSPDNLVRGETHTLPPQLQRIIVPRLGAFYSDTLKVYHKDKELVRNTDYEMCLFYHDASTETGMPVNIGIYFCNQEIDGEVTLDYQVVGGQFTGVWEAIQQYVNVLLVDPRKVYWDDVQNKPELFAPKEHFHDINDIYGLNALVPKLEEIIQAILKIRSKEMKHVYDRIFMIKKTTEDLIKHYYDSIVDLTDGLLDDVNVDITSLKQRATNLENSVQAILDDKTVENKLKQHDTKLAQLATETLSLMSSKLDKITFDNFKTQLEEELSNVVKYYTNDNEKVVNEVVSPNKLNTFNLFTYEPKTEKELSSFFKEPTDYARSSRIQGITLTDERQTNPNHPIQSSNFYWNSLGDAFIRYISVDNKGNYNSSVTRFITESNALRLLSDKFVSLGDFNRINNSVDSRITKLENSAKDNSKYETILNDLIELENRVNANQNNIEVVSGDVNTLKPQLNTVKTNLTNLTTKVDDVKKDADTINTNLTNFKNNVRNNYVRIENNGNIGIPSSIGGNFVSLNTLEHAGVNGDNFTRFANNNNQNIVTPLHTLNVNVDSSYQTQLLMNGLGYNYINTEVFGNRWDRAFKQGVERLVSDANIKELLPISSNTGNIIKMDNRGLYAESNGISFSDISALPEKKWSEGTSILARDKDGNFFRMGTEEELIQDLGVAITVDNAIKTFITGSTVTYNVKIILTNSGNGLVENGDLIVTLPKQDSTTPYTTTNVKHTLTKAVSKRSTLELTQLSNIQPGGTCVITFDLVTSSKGSFQIGAQAVTNGQVDTNAVNNHASITLYSSETVVIDNGNIDTNYKFTANCPMIVPTVVEAPEGFESWVGKRLRMFPTIDRGGDTFTKTVSDFTDYREYVECFNHLPPGRWRIKLENCSSFVVNYRHLGEYFKIDSRVEGRYDTYIVGDFEDVDVGGAFSDTEDFINGGSVDWDPNSIITLNTGNKMLAIYCRPKGSNCKWQCIRFSAAYPYELKENPDLTWRYINLYSISGGKFILPNKEVVGSNFYTPDNLNNKPGIDTKIKPKGTITVKNPYTGLTSKIRYVAKPVNEYLDPGIVDNVDVTTFFDHLKVNPISYMRIVDNLTGALRNQIFKSFTIILYGHDEDETITVPAYPTGTVVADGTTFIPHNLFSRLLKTTKRSLELTVDSLDEDVWYIFSNVGEYNTRNGNIITIVDDDTYRFRLYNGVSNTDTILVEGSEGLSIIIP